MERTVWNLHNSAPDSNGQTLTLTKMIQVKDKEESGRTDGCNNAYCGHLLRGRIIGQTVRHCVAVWRLRITGTMSVTYRFTR